MEFTGIDLKECQSCLLKKELEEPVPPQTREEADGIEARNRALKSAMTCPTEAGDVAFDDLIIVQKAAAA